MKYSINFTEYDSLNAFKAKLISELSKDNIIVKIVKADEYSNQSMKWISVMFEGKPLELLKLVAKGAGYGSKIESINSFTLDDFKEFSATITN